MNRRIERIQRQHARTFLEKSLRVGARRTKGGAFSRPSIYDGIEQHLFLIKEYEDRIGYADKPDKLRVLMEAAGMSEEEAIPGVTADDLCGLTEIVRDVNTTEVEQEDRLIDRAYIVKLGEGGNAVARG